MCTCQQQHSDDSRLTVAQAPSTLDIPIRSVVTGPVCKRFHRAVPSLQYVPLGATISLLEPDFASLVASLAQHFKLPRAQVLEAIPQALRQEAERDESIMRVRTLD